MLMTTDTSLIQRARRGDRDAFDTLYDASFGCAYAFAVRRTGERRSAERLCERILALAFHQLPSYAGDVPYAAWLLAIAKRVANEHGAPRPVGRVPRGRPLSHGAPT